MVLGQQCSSTVTVCVCVCLCLCVRVRVCVCVHFNKSSAIDTFPGCDCFNHAVTTVEYHANVICGRAITKENS